MPEGTRWNLKVSPSRTIVWPALLPPWKRTISSACSASRSITLPFPSSPHWAPTITTPGMRSSSVGLAPGEPEVGAVDRYLLVADLEQARDRSGADLLAHGVEVHQVRRHDDGALL